MEEFETLKRLIEAAAEDVAKAQGGNKAAGTRVRKSMQDIKNAAQASASQPGPRILALAHGAMDPRGGAARRRRHAKTRRGDRHNRAVRRYPRGMGARRIARRRTHPAVPGQPSGRRRSGDAVAATLSDTKGS